MEEIKCKQAGLLCGGKWDKLHDISRRVYSADGLAPTVHTMGGGNTELKIIEPICLNSKVNGKQPSLTDRVYDTCGVSTCVTTSPFFMGNIVDPIAYDEQNGYLRQDGCVGTLTTDGSTPKHNNRVVEQSRGGYAMRNNERVRKLTPRETYRLMGFDNTDFDNTAYGGVSTANYRRRLNARTMTKAEWKAFYRLTRTQKMSNSQLYKQAGNSIVTSVLMAIFGKMLNVDYETKIAELVERLKDDTTHD